MKEDRRHVDDHHLEEGGAMDLRQMIEMREGGLVIEEVRGREFELGLWARG